MKKVSHQLIRISAAFILVMFALSTVLVNPQEAQALTVSYSLSSSVDTPQSSSSTYTYTPSNSSTTLTINNSSYTYSLTDTSNSSQIEENDEEVNDAQLETPEPEPVPEPIPDIKPQTEKVVIADGTKYATDMYIIRSGKPGPVVMIVGGVHGNETAGYKAAAKVKDYTIKKGTLIVLPEANKRAVAIHRRYVSSVGDLNRDFPQSSTEKPDTYLARSIYNAVKKYDVDWLMDMHEGYDYYKNSSTSSVGQSLIYYPNSATKNVASTIVGKLNNSISSSYKEFSLLRYPIKGSLARSTAQYLGVHSFIFETCSKQTLSTRINYQLKAANTLLEQLDMK